MSDRVFLGGVPVAPDVDKLFEAFGLPAKGIVFTYRELEEVLGILMDSNRFTSVLNSWRKRLLREHNLVTEAVRGEGVRILTESQRVGHVVHRNRSAYRQARKAYVIGYSTDVGKLSDVEKSKLEAHIRFARLTCENQDRARLQETSLSWGKLSGHEKKEESDEN